MAVVKEMVCGLERGAIAGRSTPGERGARSLDKYSFWKMVDGMLPAPLVREKTLAVLASVEIHGERGTIGTRFE